MYVQNRRPTHMGTAAPQHPPISAHMRYLREWTTDRLSDLGFSVLPSSANFVFATHPRVAAKRLFEGLRARDILVRHFDKPRIDDYLRITIGTDNEMKALVSALESLVEG